MGYSTVTVRITGGQSVKIETTGGYIELEANHRLVMCNYPFFQLLDCFYMNKIPFWGRLLYQLGQTIPISGNFWNKI